MVHSTTSQHTLGNMQPYYYRAAHSLPEFNQPASSHVPLSPHSATHPTFHRPSFASTALCPGRNPLTPSYQLPVYPICTPPAPSFVRSSLDISDISHTRTHRPAMTHTRDNINVHDIDGAQSKQHGPGKRAIHSSQQQYAAADPSGLLRYMRPTAVDTSDTEQPDEASEPFSLHFASSNNSPAAPASPPCRPRSSPPTTTPTAYRSPYTRFSHSPHVLTPPSIPFSSLYHAAIPSTDPLPSFRCTLHRSSALPAKFAPLGGVDGSELDEVGAKRKWKKKRSGRMGGVSARVQCWRAGEGEVERSTVHSGVDGSGEWQRMRVHDIELVSSLIL